MEGRSFYRRTLIFAAQESVEEKSGKENGDKVTLSRQEEYVPYDDGKIQTQAFVESIRYIEAVWSSKG